ncbi:MAG TPA: PDZ domain-containing protein [Gemmataceae bacterium]|nr:PDZ domain-containing protein [Gemmataceae bacterium]
MFTSLTLVSALAVGAPALKEKEPLGKGPGYLGITFTKEDGGLMITDIKPGGPAEKGGLQVNDLIVKLDGTDMANADTGDLVKMVAGMRPGTVVAVEVRRGKESLILKVKLGPRPPDFKPTPAQPPPDIDRPPPFGD